MNLQLKTLQREILQTLLYYDIWGYPLRASELHALLPVRIVNPSSLQRVLDRTVEEGVIEEREGFYSLPGGQVNAAADRRTKAAHARKMWRGARLATHLIKRFPFVRAVFVSGELSKNATTEESDVDFFIVTAANRLWITRALLILFKKVALFNQRKYFCLNSFVTENNLELDERNLYLAMEIAQLKPLFNSDAFDAYLAANSWVHDYFPNYTADSLMSVKSNDRPSLLQKVLELPFRFKSADAIDRWLQGRMERIWSRRYPEFDDETRRRIFRCTRNESRAYVGNFQQKILDRYHERLRIFGVQD